MKHQKLYRVFILAVGILLIVMSMLLLIVSPIAGVLGIVFGILIIVIGRKSGKHSPVEQSSPALTHEELVKKYPPQNRSAEADEEETDLEIGERHRIAGTSYRREGIESLGKPNEEFSYTKRELIDLGLTDERIYELTFSPQDVQLIEEPDNPHDPNAIKVVIDGVHVGYIKSGSTAHVKKLMNNRKIQKITAKIGGGKFKLVESEYDDEKDREIYTLTTDEVNYSVSIWIVT